MTNNLDMIRIWLRINKPHEKLPQIKSRNEIKSSEEIVIRIWNNGWWSLFQISVLFFCPLRAHLFNSCRIIVNIEPTLFSAYKKIQWIASWFWIWKWKCVKCLYTRVKFSSVQLNNLKPLMKTGFWARWITVDVSIWIFNG